MSRGLARESGSLLRRKLGWLCFASAVYLSVMLLLGISGLESRFFQSVVWAPGGPLLFNVLFGVLPTLLWLSLLGGLWVLSRETAGRRAMTIAVVAVIVEQVLENVWPALSSGPAASLLMWTATALSVAGPLLIAVGLHKSRIVSVPVVRLAFVWGIAHALVGMSRVLFNRVFPATLPLELTWLQTAVFTFGGNGLVLLRMAVIVGIGMSLMSTSEVSAGEVRLTSAST